MDDTQAVAEAEAPVETPAAEAPAQEAPTTVDDLDTWDPAKLAAEVRKLKDQETKRKERFRPWEETFDGVSEEEAADYRAFVQLIRSGDPAKIERAAAWMRTNLDALSPAQQKAVQDAADAAVAAAPGDEDEFDPYDRKSIEQLVEEKAKALLDQRDEAARERERVDRITTEMNTYVADELAKLDGLADLANRESKLFKLLFVEANELDGSLPWKDRLKAAAEGIQGWLGESSKSYMQRKSAEAEVPATPAEAEPPSGAREPRSLAEATASAKERLKKFELPAGTP